MYITVCRLLIDITVHIRSNAEKESSFNKAFRITLRGKKETKCVTKETISVFPNATI